MSVCHLVWFRNDLRVTDNKALTFACEDPTATVIGVYIATPEQWAAHNVSPRQIAFLHQNLVELQHTLAKRGIPLICHTTATFADSVKWLLNFAQQQNVTGLYFNHQYELNERLRDEQLRQQAQHLNIFTYDDALLLPPGSVTTQKGDMYQVYTPFRRAFLSQLMMSDFCSFPAPKPRGAALAVENTHPLFVHQSVEISPQFTAGEHAALAKLRQFCSERVQDYQRDRDIPAINGTSQLSPYLALGVLSPRQCVNRLLAENPQVFDSQESGGFSWLNELIWREFYSHLLVSFPRLCRHQPFIEWTQHIQWNPDETALTAWKNGQTGYPIVDAAMRQLNQTGWMHNRLRMIVASFLVKDLLVDWRKGEHYFMSQLIDGTLAANNGGWQWSASTGVDASPWFRIFNPTTQGKKFDPQGTFIREWLPELRDVPEKFIHEPHTWAESHQVSLNYPTPIVDHKQARLMTLEAFEAGKRKSIKK